MFLALICNRMSTQFSILWLFLFRCDLEDILFSSVQKEINFSATIDKATIYVNMSLAIEGDDIKIDKLYRLKFLSGQLRRSIGPLSSAQSWCWSQRRYGLCHRLLDGKFLACLLVIGEYLSQTLCGALNTHADNNKIRLSHQVHGFRGGGTFCAEMLNGLRVECFSNPSYVRGKFQLNRHILREGCLFWETIWRSALLEVFDTTI